MRAIHVATVAVALLLSLRAGAEGRPSEADLFGGPEVAESVDGGAVDGGAAPAAARPAEADMFGGGPESSPAAASAPQATGPVTDGGSEASAGEDRLFGGATANTEASQNANPDDPLKIGGQLYLRSNVASSLLPKDRKSRLQSPSAWSYSAPNLLDIYFDARPNDRIRGYAVGRIIYDPTVDPTAKTAFSTSTAPTRGVLQQLWLKFDIARTVFVTAGRQQIKWGTGRFWNPTDFLQPLRLNALAIFDERGGVNVVKMHVPWEARNWNFYAFALFDNVNSVNTIGEIGGALRAEILLGPAEIGIDWVAQRGRKPRFGFDISSPLGSLPLDVYAEVALKKAEQKVWVRDENFDLSTYDPTVNPNGPFSLKWPATFSPQATAGMTFQQNLGDNDALTIGAEYFFNSLGTSDPVLYPWLLLKGQFTPFYLGKHYAGLYASLILPRGRITNSLILAAIGNISDRSVTPRLNYVVTLYDFLRVETYATVNAGAEGGEFRFGFDPSSLPIPASALPPGLSVPTSAWSAGVALRISI